MAIGPDKAAMRKRVSYLRTQAVSFRKLGMQAAEPALAESFADLARRCEEIAATIERNLGAGLYDWQNGAAPTESGG